MMWNFIELKAIYNFSTASKKVYNLSHELLREHYELQSKLFTVNNADAKPGEPDVFGRMTRTFVP